MGNPVEKQEPIAIIGAACRLPGEASSLGSLWDMISSVRTGHGKIPSDRWPADTWHHPDPDRKGGISVKHGYFIQQDISHFDAPFFSTTAKEAAAMDPMKRLLLEVSYESLENAGIPVESIYNSQTGCYVGCMTNDYEMLSLGDIHDLGHTAASATSEAMTANRVSWFYGLKGPSLTLDTACSSSLYALHLACQSLRSRETNMSLVAGVNLIISPNTMHQLSAMHMLSPEGISHTFDDRANGYGRGEGIACIIVKRLSDALQDGDTIRAVIRATGVNADGKTPSITQPSSQAQAELIRSTYDAAGLSMASTQYFECHGTGTPIGDPIELEALASTLGASRTEAGLGPLYIGSIKPNVGHTEGCSGLAGVLKAVLCLEKGMLVPTYGVENLNPKLKLNEWNLALPSRTMRWPTSGLRRVSVNSFGFGGANAHAIIDDAHHFLAHHGLSGNHNTILQDDEDSESGVSVRSASPLSESEALDKFLFVFSAKDQNALQRLTASFGNWLSASKLDESEPHFLSDLAYTLASRRSHLDFRAFCSASSLRELHSQLSTSLVSTRRSLRPRRSSFLFVFTGQGAQWPAMGIQLMSNPVFKRSICASQLHLQRLGCEWNIIEELGKTEDSQINDPIYSQTLCTVLQLAIVDLLKHWGVFPKAIVGHSSGEIAAAYAARYLTQADAVKIAYVRGLSSASITQRGSMLAAGVSREEADKYLAMVLPAQSAVVACVNSPSSVTLSGDVEAIEKLEKLLSADGKFARKLKVKTAYHSPHMRSVADDYLQKIGHLSLPAGSGSEFDDTNKPFMYSSLTGELVSPEQLGPEYWVSNMCAPVEFSAAVTGIFSRTPGEKGKKFQTQCDAIIEIGPHAALKGPVQQILAAIGGKSVKDIPYMSMVLRGQDAAETSLSVAGRLWALGNKISLAGANGHENTSPANAPRSLSNLPSYPWNHTRRFWHESHSTQAYRFPPNPRTDLLGVPADMQGDFEPRWKNYLRVSENPWIEDHQITGTTLYPAAGMLVMALEAALHFSDATKALHGFRFLQVSFERGLVVPQDDEGPVETRLCLRPDEMTVGSFHFSIFSTVNGKSWTRHCRGAIALEYVSADHGDVEELAIDWDWDEQTKSFEQLIGHDSAAAIDTTSFYNHLQAIGMEYGPLFRNVDSLLVVPSLKASHGSVKVPDTQSSMPEGFEYPHVIHPATMDSIFHLLLAALNNGSLVEEAAVPYSIADMFVAVEQPRGAGESYRGYGKLVSMTTDGRELVGDLVVSDQNWSAPKLVVKGFTLRKVTSNNHAAASAEDDFDAKKCARLEWTQDVDFVTDEQTLARLQCQAGSNPADPLSSWLDCLLRKQPVGEALVILGEESLAASSLLQDILARGTNRPGFGHLTPMATKASTLSALRANLPKGMAKTNAELWDSGKLNYIHANAPLDAIFLLGNQDLDGRGWPMAELREALKPRGHLIVVDTELVPSQQETGLQSAGFPSLISSSYNSGSLSIASMTSPKRGLELPAEVHLLISATASSTLSSLSRMLVNLFNSLQVTVHVHDLFDLTDADFSGKHVVSLLEAESPVIYSWDEAQFKCFKNLVSKVAHLLWITRGDLLASWAAGAEFAPAQGLLRVLRNEYTLSRLPHLDLSCALDLRSAASAQLVLDVWKASLADDAEMEFAEAGGMIHIPRAVDDTGFDAELQLAGGNPRPVSCRLGETRHALSLSPSRDGQTCMGTEDHTLNGPLGLNEVEVEVEFVALRPGNAHVVDAASPVMAKEAVGVVSRVGDRVTSVVLGERVILLHEEACRTRLRVDAAMVASLPLGMEPQLAVTLPLVFITAQYALFEVARLRPEQVVIINAAATDLGRAALQIVKMVGATVYALVGSKAEKEEIVERYEIPATRVFDYRLSNFVKAVEKDTFGNGADIVVNPQSNQATKTSINALGDFGYFLDLCQESVVMAQHRPSASRSTLCMAHIDMVQALSVKPAVAKALFQRTFQELQQVLLPPAVVYSVEHIGDAVERLRAGQGHSVVLSLDKQAHILTMPPAAPELVLDNNATYVLAGGLGALGLKIAGMMAAHGAKQLVFLSRSGGENKERELESLRSRGVRAQAFKCDVTDALSVAFVFQKLRSEEKCEIKGIIQCAMVLEDTIFENMTHEKWSRAFLPKSQGSRNLLAQLWPGENPFFILLSSITGVIGNTAQANYASGNAFEDALAEHARAHLGIQATSIDVGLVSDSSHFTEAGEFGQLDTYLHKYQHGWTGLQTSIKELQVALAAVMRGSTCDGQDIPGRFVLGLGNGLVRRAGSTGFERDRKFDLRVSKFEEQDEGQSVKEESVGVRLERATSLAEAALAVEESLRRQIASSVGVGIDEVDVQRPLPDFGVDSLNAVEIRNRVQREMQSEVSVFELLSSTPMADLAIRIASRSRLFKLSEAGEVK